MYYLSLLSFSTACPKIESFLNSNELDFFLDYKCDLMWLTWWDALVNKYIGCWLLALQASPGKWSPARKLRVTGTEFTSSILEKQHKFYLRLACVAQKIKSQIWILLCKYYEYFLFFPSYQLLNVLMKIYDRHHSRAHCPLCTVSTMSSTTWEIKCAANGSAR